MIPASQPSPNGFNAIFNARMQMGRESESRSHHIEVTKRRASREKKKISHETHEDVCALVKASTMVLVTLPGSTNNSLRPRLFVKLSAHASHSVPSPVFNKLSPDAIVPKAEVSCLFGHSNKVWRTHVSADGSSSDGFVIKLAATKGAISELLEDYRMHFAPDGITPRTYAPTSFGLFSTRLRGGTEWYIHITEFVQGENFGQILMKKRLGSRRHADYLEQASVKVEHVVDEFHRTSGRTHGNLYGGHLLLQRDGAKVEDVKLISFGYTRACSLDKKERYEQQEEDKSTLRAIGAIKK